jgi:PAS domain S-box-containing protein
MGKRSKTSDPGELRFKALIQNAHDGIVLYTPGGRIAFAGGSVRKITGYTEREVLNMSGADFLHPDDVDEGRRVFFELQKTPGKSVKLLQRLRHKKGHYIWTESQLTNFSHVPEINGIVSNFSDVTARREAEEKMREAQEILEIVNRNVSEGIFMGVLNKRFIFANEAFIKMLGYKSFRELEKIRPRVLYAMPSQHKRVMAILRETGELKDYEIWLTRKNGTRLRAMSTCRMLSHEGREGYVVGSIKDITNEKAAEDALIESRNFLDNIINTVAAPIFVKDTRHRWIKFNTAFAKLLDLKPEEILGKNDKNLGFFKKSEIKAFWENDNKVFKTGKTLLAEERVTDSKGEVHDLLTVKSRYIDDNGEPFAIGFITDITFIKKTEEKISQLNTDLQGILESTKESIFAIDNKFNYTSFNKSYKRTMKLLYNQDVQVGSSKLKVIRKSREEKWLAADLKSAMGGAHFVVERKIDYPQFQNRTIQLAYNPVRDGHGVVKGVAIFISDITDRKKTEARLRALNEELRDQNWQLAMREEELKSAMEELSERNFELDQLMYKTSHDLRSPLSSIMGLVHLANLDKESAHRDQYLEKIEGRIKKLDEFIRSMLNYARVNRAEIAMGAIDLKTLATACIRELDHLENFKNIDSSITVHGESIPFRSDELRVKIIFSNIISNAYKYYNAETKSFLKIRVEINPLVAKIEFKDNGIGIKHEHVDKIFNMFYRATERSQGSGLGMYIVKQAVEKLGGTIRLKSEYGTGTTIKITLPNQ